MRELKKRPHLRHPKQKLSSKLKNQVNLTINFTMLYKFQPLLHPSPISEKQQKNERMLLKRQGFVVFVFLLLKGLEIVA